MHVDGAAHYGLTRTRLGRGLQGPSRCELIGEALPKHFLEFRDGALVFRDQYVVEPLTFQDCS